MVRGSLKMELIKNEKARNSSFQRRKLSMKKKFDELTTLCNVRGAMLVHGANNKTELWVANNGQLTVSHMFHKYRNPTRDINCEKRTVNLSRYYLERKKKASSELEKLRKSNVAEAEENMWKSISLLDNEIAAAKASKDNLVTTNRNHTQLDKSNSSEACYPQPLAVIYPQEPLVCYLPPPIAAVYPQQRQPMQQQHGVGASFGANLTPNSGAVVLWNNNGFAGACGSNGVYAPLNSVPVYYVPMRSGMVTRSMRASGMCYYYGGQAVQLPPPPPPMQQYYLQYPRRMTQAAAAAAASSNQVRASQI